MRRLLLFVPLLALVSAFSTAAERARPEDVAISSERLSRIGEFVRDEVEKQRIAGAVTLVARRGRIAYLQAA